MGLYNLSKGKNQCYWYKQSDKLKVHNYFGYLVMLSAIVTRLRSDKVNVMLVTLSV